MHDMHMHMHMHALPHAWYTIQCMAECGIGCYVSVSVLVCYHKFAQVVHLVDGRHHDTNHQRDHDDPTSRHIMGHEYEMEGHDMT